MQNLRKVCAILTAAMVAAWAVPAGATLFTLDSYDISYRNVDPGLVLGVEKLAPTGSVDLPVGTYTYPLFRVYTNECCINLFPPIGEDIVPYGIQVDFNFSAPEQGLSGSVSGYSRGVLFPSSGRVRWDGPAEFHFGNGGFFTISLEDVDFGLGGYGNGANVLATLAFVQDSTTPPQKVPEPSTLMLLGAGLVGLALLRRRHHT